MTFTTGNAMKQEIKKEMMLEAIQWGCNDNPNDIWMKINALEMRSQLMSLIAEQDKLKWVRKHSPSAYNDTIKNASMKLCLENQDWAYTVTYEDILNEVNEKYESFKKGSKKRAELSLLTSRNGNGGGHSDGGGRGGNRLSGEQQSKRDKAKNKFDKNGSSTNSGK